MSTPEHGARAAAAASSGSSAPPAAPGPGPPPAFYARRGGPGWDWWTLLHPPYTLWNVSYAAIGAALAPRLDWAVAGATVLAFVLAVGIAAHALDEWNGRPLGTRISDRALWAAAIASLAAACALGVAAARHAGPVFWPLIAVGVVLVLGYNLELFHGALHTDLAFALAWGGFPTAVGYLAQRPPLSSPSTVAAVLAVAGTTGISAAQRRLSTPARMLRRRAEAVEARLTMRDGIVVTLDRARLLEPLDGALKLLSYAVPLTAGAMLLSRVGHW